MRTIFIILVFASICTAGILKQSTVATVVIGPLVDSVDGKTPIETLDTNDITAAIYKNAVRTVIDANELSGGTDGYWLLALTATDTNTPGNLKITLRDDDVFLSYSADFQIWAGRSYEAIIQDVNYLQINTYQLLDSALLQVAQVIEDANLSTAEQVQAVIQQTRRVYKYDRR